MKAILRLPLLLILAGIAALSMWGPAIVAISGGDHAGARAFFYAGTLGIIGVALVGIAQATREHRQSGLRQLSALLGAFALLPLLLAVPFYEALGTTSFLNAYVEMVSAVTTTGAPFFPDPERLSPALHLWRAQVAWMGGFLMWVAAAAVLAPLNLGGFEVTAAGEPGQGVMRDTQIARASAAKRLDRATMRLFPVYMGLTMLLWTCLIVAGDAPLVALCHAMSVMSTSGISPVGGLDGAGSGIAGEALVFLFLLFALSRLTFSTDTVTTNRIGLGTDPEFRMGLIIVGGVTLFLFLRHWSAAYDVDAVNDLGAALMAFWGGLFTVMSYLTTTGFESTAWEEARAWSALPTPGLVLMGLALIGGGVATTAGGVKLLRVFALFLHGRRELERLVHPSSVGRATVQSRRLRRRGAFVAWIFFMLFALSLALVTCLLAALGMDFDDALVMAIATLSTTGPLITSGADAPIALAPLAPEIKLVLAGAMVLGRLETLAIIALLTTELWADR